MALQQFRFITEKQLITAMKTAKPEPTEAWLNVWIPLIETQVEQYCNRKLGFESNIVEWFDPSDDGFLILDQRPVHRIVEVRRDAVGGYGQIPNSFGTSSIMTAGQDYFLQIDGRGPTAGISDTGILWRANGQSWGYRRMWQGGLLAAAKERVQGTIKVTYDGGYKITDDETTNQIPGCVAAAVTQAAGVWYDTMVKVGVTSGENVSGYGWNQVLGVNLGDNQFASVRQMLATIRSMRPGAGFTPG